MGLISHGLAFGLGYTIGRPDGRRQLTELGRKAAELTNHPEVKRLRERGWDLAGNTARAARTKLTATSRGKADRERQPRSEQHAVQAERSAPAVGSATADSSNSSAGFSGRTAAEDSHDAVIGRRVAPSPAVPETPPAGRL